jgi:hypothetical protein
MSYKLDEFSLHLLLENYISDNIGNSIIDSSKRFAKQLFTSNVNAFLPYVYAIYNGVEILESMSNIIYYEIDDIKNLVNRTSPFLSKKVIMQGGVYHPTVKQGHAICWIFDPETKNIWLANSGEGIENHKLSKNCLLRNTVRVWKAMNNEEYTILCNKILFATCADQHGKAHSNKNTNELYKHLINNISLGEVKLPFEDKSGTLGQYKWSIEDGYFYSETQITGTCTFHSMMWILYVNMGMKYNLINIFRKKELHDMDDQLVGTYFSPDSLNCFRLIYNLYVSDEIQLKNIKKMILQKNAPTSWKNAEAIPIKIQMKTQQISENVDVYEQWTIGHIEKIESIRQKTASHTLISEMLDKHSIGVSLEVMRNVITKSKMKQNDWIEVLKEMTEILAHVSNIWFKLPLKHRTTEHLVNQQFEENFEAVRVQLVVRMFEINEHCIETDYRLPRIKSTVKFWPRSYSGILMDIGNMRLLNSYSAYLFDPLDIHKTYDNLKIKKESTREFIGRFWKISGNLPINIKSFLDLVGSNFVTVCLITSYAFLMLPIDMTYPGEPTQLYLDNKSVFRFKQTAIDWNGVSFNNWCEKGIKAEILRFSDMYLSTNLIQGNFILDETITNAAKFTELMNILYETCNDEYPEVVISTNWYINYKTNGRWLEKRQEIERGVYVQIVSQIETCNIYALLFYIVKIVQHHIELSVSFKESLCTKIKCRLELDRNLSRVVCAILLNESLSSAGIALSFEQTDLQMMTLQACILLYLRCCSKYNYDMFLSSLINTVICKTINIKTLYKLDLDFIENELDQKTTAITDSEIHRTHDNAVLIERPADTPLEKISEMLDVAKIKHIFWHLSGQVILHIPILKYLFKMQHENVILVNECTKETWMVKWVDEVPCSARDWGYNVHSTIASFFIENADKVLGVIFMHVQGHILEMARTIFDLDREINHIVILTNNAVYLQFAANLCMPIFQEPAQVYFIGAVYIAGGNMRCIQTLFERLQYVKKNSDDPFEAFVEAAIRHKCMGTAFYPLLSNDAHNIKRRRLENVSIESAQNTVEIPTFSPIDALVTVTDNNTPYPTLSIDSSLYNASHLVTYKKLLDAYFDNLNKLTFSGCVDFHPSCKVAWLVSVVQVTEKALPLKSEYERFAMVKHLHEHWVNPPSEENDFVAISGKFVSKQQKIFILNMEDKIWTKETSDIHQAIMGIGKSNVIMPLLVKRSLSRKFNVIVIQPPHLVNAASHILFSFLPYSLQKEVKILDHTELRTDAPKWVMVLSDSELKKIILDARRYKEDTIINKINSAVVLMDEIDEMSNPLRSELNIPNGDYVAHPLKILDMSKYYSNIYLSSVEDKQDEWFDLGVELNNKITKDAQSCMSLRYNMDYGKSADGGFAVPYRGVSTPVAGASFSDPEIKHILTCMTKYKAGLVLEDIRQFRRSMSAYSYMGTEFMDEYLSQISSIFKDIKSPFTYLLINSSRVVLKRVGKNKDLIKYYVINILLPTSTFQEKQDNIAFMDLIEEGTCKMKIGFSGTTNMLSPPFEGKWDFKPDIIPSEDAGKQIQFTMNKKLLRITDIFEFFNSHDVVVDEAGLLRTFSFQDIKDKTKKTLVYFDETDQVQEIPQKKVHFLTKQTQQLANTLAGSKKMIDPQMKEHAFLGMFDTYDVVIDAENTFAKVSCKTIEQHTKKTLVCYNEEAKVYYLNKQTQQLAQTLPGNKTIIDPKIQQKDFLSLFDAYDVIIDKENIFSHLSEETISKNTKKKVMRLGEEHKVYYFDQKHTTGTDLHLPSRAKGVVLIDLELSILSKVAQAAFRLRNVNMGQTVEYAAKTELPSKKLFDHLRENEINQNQPKKAKHWLHAIRTQNRKEQDYLRNVYLMNVPYSLVKITLPSIKNHKEWILKLNDSEESASLFQTEQKIEHKIEQKHIIEHQQLSLLNWSYHLDKPVVFEDYIRYTIHDSDIISMTFPDCYLTFNYILISPFVAKMLSMNLDVPRYILVYTENNLEYCRLITPGEALALPLNYRILNNQGISINNTDVEDRSDLVLISMILCGYRCPLHEQLRACQKLEINKARENIKCIVGQIFAYKGITLTHVLKEYINTTKPYDQILQDLEKNTTSDEIFGKYVLNLSTKINSISNYRHKIREIITTTGVDSKIHQLATHFPSEQQATTEVDSKIHQLATHFPSEQQATTEVDSKIHQLATHLPSEQQSQKTTTEKSHKLLKYAAGAGGLISLMALANKYKKKHKKKKQVLAPLQK